MREWGRLDVVVANTGVARAGGIDTLPAEDIDRMIDVNVRGVVHTIRAALPHLDGDGRIVTVGSVNAERAPFAGAAAQAMIKWLALPRIGTPEEVSALVSHLVGPEGAFITGATLAIDGGFTA